MYRINYGNGQVSNTFSNKSAAMRAMESVDNHGGMSVQKYVGDGMWARA